MREHASQILVCALVAVLCAYYGGRVHEWYLTCMDRDRSFREGYNHGYRALFARVAHHSQAAPEDR
jgi:hypothetical protein